MSRSIAFFDFDGTITTRDTMIEFLAFFAGKKKFYTGMIRLLPSLLAMKLGLTTNRSAKEKMLTLFLGGRSEIEVRASAKQFSEKKLPALIRKQALVKLNELKKNNTAIVIVSASADLWLTDWCSQYDAAILATKLEVKEGLLTGTINGENCHGEEKVRRIREKYTLADYDDIYCFGDTSGDLPMLALTRNRYYKPFR